MADKNFKVKTSITSPTPISLTEGGTGQTSASNALNALLPLQTGNTGKVLKTDGTDTSWIAQAVAYERGGTASRPVGPSVGDLYYNTDNNNFEQYTSLGWFVVAAQPQSPSAVAATNQPSSRAYNNGQMSVAFTPSSNGGHPVTFTVTPTPTTSPATFTGSSSPITVTGLASNTQYTHTVSASSAYGTSSASSASTGVTATTVPQAPTIGSPTNTSGAAYASSTNSASVAVTPGATGGSSITGYSVISSPGALTGSSATSPVTVSGLTVGTAYTFTATATNTNGTSTSSSASSSLTPSTVPQAPTIGTATAADGLATVTYTAGATGGSAITTFTATSTPGSLTGTGSSPITVSGLTNGTAYTFAVKGTNANGVSADSAASNSITPAAGSGYINLNNFYGSAQTVTFSSIPSGYGRLIIRGSLHMLSGYSGLLGIRFNGDTAQNYYNQSFLANGSTSNVTQAVSLDNQFNAVGASSMTGNEGHVFELEITNYTSTTLKKSISLLVTQNGGGSYQSVQMAGGTWNSTAAITSITLFNRQNSEPFASFPWSHAYLFGLKEA